MVKKAGALKKFIDQCLEHRDLAAPMSAFQHFARALIDAKLRDLFKQHRKVSDQSAGHYQCGFEIAEYNLRAACKKHRIAIPNLTLSKLVQHAMRSERKSC